MGCQLTVNVGLNSVYAAVLVAIVAGIAGMPSTLRFAFGVTTAGVCARASVHDISAAPIGIIILRMDCLASLIWESGAGIGLCRGAGIIRVSD